jgi:hypothetical protein
MGLSFVKSPRNPLMPLPKKQSSAMRKIALAFLGWWGRIGAF